MKTFLLFLCLFAVTQAYWGPRSDTYCQCSGGGSGLISTFDGYLKSIVDSQKTVVAQYGFKNDTDPLRRVDRCRFMLRVVTSWDIQGELGDLYIDWAAFSFDVPKPNNKPRRNFVFGQCNDGIYERGKGVNGVVYQETISRYFVYTNNGFNAFVFKDFTGMLKIRSDNCEYAFNWRAAGRDTTFTLFLGDQFADKSLLGMCGDCDGIMENDATRCDGEPLTYPLNTANATREISDSCADGKHQTTGTTGGTKLNCLD